VGLGGVIGGVAAGARVIGVESQPYRARLALALGAEAVVDPSDPEAAARIRDLTGGGADRGIDCSGSAQGQRLLIDAMRRRGHLAFIGEGGDLTVHVSRDLLRKGLTLHGHWHYNLADAPALLGLIGRLGPALDRCITHTFPMGRFREAWDLQAAGHCGKVLLEPWAVTAGSPGS
jgi:L-iditol 2-dehydrogenase